MKQPDKAAIPNEINELSDIKYHPNKSNSGDFVHNLGTPAIIRSNRLEGLVSYSTSPSSATSYDTKALEAKL